MPSITTLTTLALAALTAAVPLTTPAAPCNSSEFTMTLQYGYPPTNLSLTAIDSDNPGTLNIVGLDPASYRGTPVKQTGNTTNSHLSFDIQAGDDCETSQTGQFSIYVPDMGELYGQQQPITATKGGMSSEMFVGGGVVFPHLTAASQSWYGEFDNSVLVG
ncbi:uncharacterized protein LTR77_008660 [Saxophila tyrrhenica]|uniref:Uncharacterized protein n=1 Tax=Saxophila tyrrhenica TaxID=1690608 RepID=A0AAV9NZZ0_9PEZI|nr:hypothetical protein LTR77_008660 [Saxophila tyrrhenica]